MRRTAIPWPLELTNLLGTKQDQGNAPSVAKVEEDLATKQAELELNHPMNHDVIRQVSFYMCVKNRFTMPY